MPEVPFHVFAITHSPGQAAVFSMPENVQSLTTLPLWGTPEAGLREHDISGSYQRRVRTGRFVIQHRFLPYFEEALAGLLDTGTPPQALGRALFHLYEYFKSHDYALSMGSPRAWEAFVSACASHRLPLTLHEATTCMRWLKRYLAVLAVTYPPAGIVHASMAGLAGLPGVLLKLEHGAHLLLSEHGLHMREMYATLSRSGYSSYCRQFLARFHRALVNLHYHYADRITALGSFNRMWQIKLGADPHKICLAPNGVDPELYHPRDGASRSRPTVLTMARIFPLKGVDVLLEAAQMVRDRVPDVLFRILGEPADREYYEHCRKIVRQHGLEHNVSFGVTHESHLAYGEADVFCLPSLSEAMPYALLEAMMSGCPAVCSDVGNIREIVGNTGLLVKPKSPPELACALLQFLDGPDAISFRMRMARAALERARSHFQISTCVGQFRRIYTDFAYDTRSAAMSATTN
jgi:glycosyltransferase involved in cell wall biosynthesis